TAKKMALQAAGVEIIETPPADGHVDLKFLMAELGKREIDGVLIEGGGEIHAAAFAAGLVNAVQAYIDPKIVGGCSAKSPVGGLGIASLSDAVQLSVKKVERLGPDILVTADVQGSKR
ncbi:MAG: dihydrofolate reductase family protein, partial [Lachnospiraceae bacterium]|nr:dihydrofolate reductase family protein [Lachnospiraceae bacterium]